MIGLSKTPFTVSDDTTVSMNMLLFTPSIFSYIEKKLPKFLEQNKDNAASAEFLIPDVLFEAIEAYSKDGQRIIEELSVINIFDEGKDALKEYSEKHKKDKSREMYVYHTNNEELKIEDIYKSVNNFYPTVNITQLEKDIAGAKLLANEGLFDTTFNAKSDLRPVGYYRNSFYDFYVEQPTKLWGTRFFTGWRAGLGSGPALYQPGRGPDPFQQKR